MNVETKEERITEKQYRTIKDRLSYSALKLMDTSLIKFYKKHILGEKVDEKINFDMKVGSVVDCKILSPEAFDSRFAIPSFNKPTGQMGDFVEDLYNTTLKYIDSEGVITTEFSTIFKEAYDIAKRRGDFKGKDETKVLELFKSTDKNGDCGESYYSECRNMIGKEVVDMNVIEAAEKIYNELYNSELEAGRVIRLKSEGDIEVYSQFAIMFTLNNLPFKSLLDKMVINHKDKTIQVYDLKVSWALENFEYKYKNDGYYIQNGLYTTAVEIYKNEQNPKLKDYTILPFKFIVADSTNAYKPLVYNTQKGHFQDAIMGFTDEKGNYYRGIHELCEEINHHLSTSEWRISKLAYENNGEINML